MSRAIAEVLKNMELFAEFRKFKVVMSPNTKGIRQACLAALSPEDEEVKPECFKSIECEASSWLELTNGAKHFS